MNTRFNKDNVSGKKNPRWKGGRFLTAKGYVRILMPDHPNFDSHGYIGEHVLICEKALGKYLPKKAMPHHVNGIKNDNNPKNLVICQDQAYHSLLHQRERALRESGNANNRMCKYCKSWDVSTNLIIDTSNHVYHKECHKINHRLYWRKRYSKSSKALSVWTGI